jgi:hypothetical protein
MMSFDRSVQQVMFKHRDTHTHTRIPVLSLSYFLFFVPLSLPISCSFPLFNRLQQHTADFFLFLFFFSFLVYRFISTVCFVRVDKITAAAAAAAAAQTLSTSSLLRSMFL